MAKLFTCSNIDVTGQSNCLIQVRQFLFMIFLSDKQCLLMSYDLATLTIYMLNRKLAKILVS